MNNKALFNFKRKHHPALIAALYGVAMITPNTGYSADDGDTLTISGQEQNNQGYSAGSSSVASKTPTPRLDEAQSVSVVTRQQLDDYQAESLSDAMRFVAGVSESNTLAGTEDGFVRRGFGSNSDGSVTSPSHAGTRLNVPPLYHVRSAVSCHFFPGL